MPRKRGRAKDECDEDEDVDVINVEGQLDSPVAKKHKKHKKKHGSESSSGKRHSGKRHGSSAEESGPAAAAAPAVDTSVRGAETLKPPIKLKIRIGSETIGTSRSDAGSSAILSIAGSSQAGTGAEESQDDGDDDETVDVGADAPCAVGTSQQGDELDVDEIDDFGQDEDDDQRLPETAEDDDEEDEDDDEDDGQRVGSSRRSDDSTSEDEKQWLDALESGNLEDYERKKQERDPALLTARQRALLSGAAEVELLELPSGYKKLEMTEEQQQRRKQRALKRRLQAHEKKEKAKKQTLDRLLKKQQETSKRAKKGLKAVQKPFVRYINSLHGCSISASPGVELPIAALPPRAPPAPATCCGVTGCINLKRYTCSKTGVPLCSLECYKKNLALDTSSLAVSSSLATVTAR